MPNGQAFGLRDAELGAYFGGDEAALCFLRGNFSFAAFRGLVARGLFPSNPELVALAQPVAVQLNMKPEAAAKYGKDAATVQQIGRRVEQNIATDDVVRKLLLFEEWLITSVAPYGQKPEAPNAVAETRTADVGEDEALMQLMTEMAGELWLAAELAGEAAQPPQLEKPLAMEEAVKLFFEQETWSWEEVVDGDGVLRTVYDGQNGSWMCYTQILNHLQQVVFYSICPVPVPIHAVPTMAEFLCRANADLSVGNFEMDFSHHGVSFRTSLDVTDVGLAPLLFRNMVYQNLSAMDDFMPELMGIIATRRSK
jgi:hypothetical protein